MQKPFETHKWMCFLSIRSERVGLPFFALSITSKQKRSWKSRHSKSLNLSSRMRDLVCFVSLMILLFSLNSVVLLVVQCLYFFLYNLFGKQLHICCGSMRLFDWCFFLYKTTRNIDFTTVRTTCSLYLCLHRKLGVGMHVLTLLFISEQTYLSNEFTFWFEHYGWKNIDDLSKWR